MVPRWVNGSKVGVEEKKVPFSDRDTLAVAVISNPNSKLRNFCKCYLSRSMKEKILNSPTEGRKSSERQEWIYIVKPSRQNAMVNRRPESLGMIFQRMEIRGLLCKTAAYDGDSSSTGKIIVHRSILPENEERRLMYRNVDVGALFTTARIVLGSSNGHP